MPIIYTTKSIFDTKFTKAEILVNPVNCVGVMGAGLAKQFKEKFPDMFEEYWRLCSTDSIHLGEVWFTWARKNEASLKVCLFPTKNHWQDKSCVQWIEAGLDDFKKLPGFIPEDTICSFPKLGCGLGGLDWKSQVQPLMHKYLDVLSNRVYIHVESEDEFL
jgi:O-acetyl-ADP-ribose deacetylase (regulator of RNase III)